MFPSRSATIRCVVLASAKSSPLAVQHAGFDRFNLGIGGVRRGRFLLDLANAFSRRTVFRHRRMQLGTSAICGSPADKSTAAPADQIDVLRIAARRGIERRDAIERSQHRQHRHAAGERRRTAVNAMPSYSTTSGSLQRGL